MAVVEAGQVYFVRTDHIGRPVFATDTLGAKVWEASYRPFGGVQTSTGASSTLRFPGQWFQSETGLHQNWMRDYDPTLGRYIQADPLGLVDGASIYGYALQNPGRYTDPKGEQSLTIDPGMTGGDILPGGQSTPGGITAGGIAIGIGRGVTGVIGLILTPTQMGDGTRQLPFEGTCEIDPKRQDCITQCTALALPTDNYGISFFRCMNACMSDGNSGFPEWDKYFP